MGLELKLLHRPVKGVLNILYPPQCHGCGEVIVTNANSADAEGGLCPACWRETGFITGPVCDLCGAPLPGDADETAICESCHDSPRPWMHGRASFLYAGAGKQLVLSYKHGDRPDLAPALGRWLASSARALMQPDMLVAAVPLHPRRLISRRYNQAALLAAQVAKLLDLSYCPDLLVRHRYSPAQDHLSPQDRIDNVAESFRVKPNRRAMLEDRPILLIDDVMTTGATLSAATDALNAAGCREVCVAVLARTVKDV